jgi:hypothetical protein
LFVANDGDITDQIHSIAARLVKKDGMTLALTDDVNRSNQNTKMGSFDVTISHSVSYDISLPSKDITTCLIMMGCMMA